MDSAFCTAPFPGHTTEELHQFLAERIAGTRNMSHERRALMEGEIARRERVAQGDVSVMTPGERLRHFTKAA